jgi:lysozyme family protein
VSQFQPAVDLLLGHEGGFTDNPNDPGNWTGGRVGQGELKGTKWGISAATYPNEDIKGMPRERAVEIYLTDWWLPGGYERLNDQQIANRVFSFAANGGQIEAVQLLQMAISGCFIRVDVDGILGPKTVTAANAAPAYILLCCFKSAMAARYDTITDLNRAMRWARNGWLNRAFS